MAYYIGVDGGGTKTAYALFDENKNMLHMVKGPGSNHENLETSFEGAAAILWDGITKLVKEAGITVKDVDYTLMGLAGIDHPYQHDLMKGILAAKGLRNFEIYNDGFIVVKAGSESGAAIGYNCGTGVCCNAVDSEGKMLQLAGLGVFSGDTAGGSWISEEVFKAVYNDLFVLTDKTVLTQKLMERLKITDREGFLAVLPNIDSDRSDDYIRLFIDVFFESVEEGDEVALNICRTTAHRGAQFISAIARQMHFNGDEVEVVLSGSVNAKLKNPTYLKLLTEEAQALSPQKLRFIYLDKAPVTGCVNWILQDFVK